MGLRFGFGHALGRLVGNAADYLAIAVLALLGSWMLLHEEGDESERVAQLTAGRGLVLLALGVSISLDELAMGSQSGSSTCHCGLPSS